MGDTVYDMQCARGAGVDFALARWGNPDGRVDADYDEPTPMALLENSDKKQRQEWGKARIPAFLF